MDKRYCKRCLIREFNKEEYREMIGRHIDIISKKDKSDEILYNQRLDTCKECDRLNAGTCLACGCYVEIRAAMRRSSCPKKKW